MKNLDVKIAQYEARLRDLKAQMKRSERDTDKRRKYLYGEAYLAMIETISGDQRAKSLARVHEAITDPRKRAFLDLPTLPESSVEATHADVAGSSPEGSQSELPFD